MLPKTFLILLVLTLAVGFFYFKPINQTNFQPSPVSTATRSESPQAVTVIAENLDTPWALAFLPTSEILVTERPGRVRLISNGQLQVEPIAKLSQVKEIGEGGLLGIALHPKFSENHLIYLYYTYQTDGDNTLNRVVKMVYQNGKLSDESVMVDKIPGAANHNGGRIKFGPDGYLYITTGDAQNPSQAQDKNSLAGKILRVMDNGQIPPDNPFNNSVYSYGHRNPQGLAWDNQGRLWATEHGRSGVLSGLDELNLIEKGKNYGWPAIQGSETKTGMETPKLNSGSTTWAPAGVAYLNTALYFGGLRGQTLYQADISSDSIKLKEHFASQFGRIREVILGPDNMLYITTSNQDGRGIPRSTDDQVLKINPSGLMLN